MTLSHLPGPSPPPSSHFGPRERAIPSDITLRVPNGLIHRENEGSCLRGSSKGIGFHHGRLPDTRLKVVSNVLLVDVYTIPLESCKTVTDRNKVCIQGAINFTILRTVYSDPPEKDAALQKTSHNDDWSSVKLRAPHSKLNIGFSLYAFLYIILYIFQFNTVAFAHCVLAISKIFTLICVI